MTTPQTDLHNISAGAQSAVNDLLDNVARIEPGQQVLLLAHTDGLSGSDNLVDETAISWIQSGVEQRGAHASVLWISDRIVDFPDGRIPPVLRAAMAGCDVFINHSFDFVTEDLRSLRDYFTELGIRYVRNFATTAALLNTAWAQTPSELLCEIRFQAGAMFSEGAEWRMTDENGTDLRGIIAPPSHRWFPTYASYREVHGGYLPWPEWVYPPINLSDTSGVFVFDRMLSWWSRFIGVSAVFSAFVRLEINEGRICRIEGGEEAAKIREFLKRMRVREGNSVDEFTCLHGGVHPQARIGRHECPNANYQRLIEHAHTSNIHVHIGSEPKHRSSPYWLHITGDTRTATLTVGDVLVYDRGRLCALDSPSVLEVAQKYPDRPGLESRS